MKYVLLISIMLLASHALAQDASNDKIVRVQDVKLTQEMEDLVSKRVELRKQLALQTKQVREDQELIELMNEIKTDRKALQEKVKVYQSKRLEKIKRIPEVEGIMSELNVLEPQIVEIRKQLKCIEMLQKTSSSQ